MLLDDDVGELGQLGVKIVVAVVPQHGVEDVVVVAEGEDLGWDSQQIVPPREVLVVVVVDVAEVGE